MNKLIIKLKILLSHPDVVVIIENNNLRTLKGRAGSATLKELSTVLQKKKISTAYLLYHKRKNKLELFGIPALLEQKVRNVWYSNHRNL